MNIRSDRLIVSMDPPNQGWATNNRFDRTGTIVSVVLDGKHTFMTPEVLSYKNWTTGGMGLMAEFAWPETVSFAKPGERYHKIGVGMLEKGRDEVNMRTAYFASCEQYDAICEADGPAAAIFVSKAPMLGGWAFELHRRAEVKENQLVMTATLLNQSEKAMNLAEYNHNFVNIDDLPIGPDYRIDLSYDMLIMRPGRGVIRQNGRSFIFDKIPESAFYVDSDNIGDASTYSWKMSNRQSSTTLSECVSLKPCRMQLWGTAHVLSTEVFLPICVQPGQSQTWTRTWTFSC